MEALTTLIEAVAKFGPFPLGILVGIILARFAYRDALMYSEKEKTALREEKKQLRETVQAQQERIDKLHEDVFNTKTIER